MFDWVIDADCAYSKYRAVCCRAAAVGSSSLFFLLCFIHGLAGAETKMGTRGGGLDQYTTIYVDVERRVGRWGTNGAICCTFRKPDSITIQR
jgi:hypothetical protein